MLERKFFDNGLARTPVMGWNSWNQFGPYIDEKLIKEIADAFVTTGLRESGYNYVNIDDNWQGTRSLDGEIEPDPVRFPGGMRMLADYVHQRDLKLGIYTCIAALTCEKAIGSLDHEEQDAITYAAWEIDLVKVDWCWCKNFDANEKYSFMSEAIRKSGREMIFSICNWGRQEPWNWAPYIGNMWRTTSDIYRNKYAKPGDEMTTWKSIMEIIDNPVQNHHEVAGPGHWNDPDMLEIGNGGLNFEEAKTHMSMWCIMAAPLILGNDIRQMDEEIRFILTHPEVIAIDQDVAGRQGYKIKDDGGGRQVWMKPLHTQNEVAVALLNKSDDAQEISFQLDEVGIYEKNAMVRDVWDQNDLGDTSQAVNLTVPPHGTRLLRVSGF